MNKAMHAELMTGTTWDYAGIKFKDAQPMLVERKICKLEDEGTILVVNVPDGPHPFLDNGSCTTRHFIQMDDITGISFYKINPPALIQTPPGARKSKKIIAEA